jgi:flagellum-specific peptidoglycan hydrolase FlgJ
MVKLASLTGYTPGSASVTFGNIKRKLKQLGEGLAADGPATPKNGRSKATATPKSSTSKRTASSKPADADDEDQPTPSKRPKKTAAPKKSRDANDDDDDDEHFVPRVKKEEVEDLNASANDFYAQMHGAAAGYAEAHDDSF